MAPNLPNTTALTQLQGAFAAGDVRLVDEDARSLTYDKAVGQRCWAHLRDAVDGSVYVYELKSSGDLLQVHYLALLGLNV